jgi:YD repeat-containing protein
VATTGVGYPYDPNGNLATKTEGSDTWAYTWNAENQLVKVEKNSVEVARCSYNPIGRPPLRGRAGAGAGQSGNKDGRNR